LFIENFGTKFYTYKLDDWIFSSDSAYDRLLKHFQTNSLKGFGIQGLHFGIIAAGAILHYLDITQHDNLKHITKLTRIEEDNYVWLDKFTIRNLELFQPLNTGGKSFLDIIDKSLSPMGSRMLKRWIALPLKLISKINDRLSIVDYFIKNENDKVQLEELIKQIGDLERVISKISTLKASPRDIFQLKSALNAIALIKSLCKKTHEKGLQIIAEQLNPCEIIKTRIEKEIVEDPPNQLNKGNVISTGVSTELDELRKIRTSAKEFLLEIQQRESINTGIPSLKISYNNVFGYYIEVRNTHKEKVPPEWIRKQTLVSAERYITEELKEFEEKILGAEDKILELETKIYNELLQAITEYIIPVQLNATLVAKLDCLLAFASNALENNYCRPEINDTKIINIKAGRHPVIEKQLPPDDPYVSNDVILDDKEQQIIIITGPNMAGKSALLRQTALIVLMAQMGSYVPADSASIGYVDKIFTRVGASDNISLGESTFMVEMNEAASILNNISDRSLILLDELGRGTSTYDGISIAWAIVEYLHEHSACHAKTLFATHYHELNEMEASFKKIKNYNVSVKEINNKVIFLRKLKRGGSEHSFGIHVAQMAGMPKSVVNRANEILKELENSHNGNSLSKPVAEIGTKREGYQLSIFQLDDPVLKQIRDEIKKLDINNLTPVEALNMLNEIKKISGL
ncbi:MAG: DNA mismatch repair protein MutS, partial [Bacteroidales bacterium]|nr:DNA mismatch repair protein MutS [Bacteroidales bacterium]